MSRMNIPPFFSPPHSRTPLLFPPHKYRGGKRRGGGKRTVFLTQQQQQQNRLLRSQKTAAALGCSRRPPSSVDSPSSSRLAVFAAPLICSYCHSRCSVLLAGLDDSCGWLKSATVAIYEGRVAIGNPMAYSTSSCGEAFPLLLHGGYRGND